MKIKFDMKMLIFNSCLLLLRRLKVKNGLTSVIYFITVNKYRFCISVIRYINVQTIGIGSKKSISVDHYSAQFFWMKRVVMLFCLRCGGSVRCVFSPWLSWMTTASRWRKTCRCSSTTCVWMLRWRSWKWWGDAAADGCFLASGCNVDFIVEQDCKIYYIICIY